ncbi:hypothetical protein SH528x_004633 [Novipirellula sp. SH528]|uniref:hypothetical protein n=1 Tax=Novipirellula sp. SH528 TaxID=3454466 RepID=UPI003F9ED9F4
MVDSFGLSHRPLAILESPPPHVSEVQDQSKSRLTQRSDDRVSDSLPSGRPPVVNTPANTAVELVNKAVELQQQLAAGYLDIMM